MTPGPKSRKEKRYAGRQSQDSMVDDLEARLRQMSEQCATWKMKYEEAREKEAKVRAKRKEEKRKRLRYYERAVPIVAAVVLKSIYARAFGIVPKRWPESKHDDRAQKIRNLEWRFAQLGYQIPQQVDGLAAIVSGRPFPVHILHRQNVSGHTGCAFVARATFARNIGRSLFPNSFCLVQVFAGPIKWY
ncbi:hypothetical protein HOY80DRAFT_1000308 [Tuber brumale]|nr:hypothetical protein HOY80DRAFT_1000308 [Tuber brumale]